MRFLFGKKGLRLSQSPGAFRKPDGDISPLYVFFGVENAGSEEIEITSIRVSPKGEDTSLAGGDIEGDVPARISPKERVRFEVRAKTLAGAARNTGHAGTPKLSFVVTDGEGREHRHDFSFRVDEYLELKDE